MCVITECNGNSRGQFEWLTRTGRRSCEACESVLSFTSHSVCTEKETCSEEARHKFEVGAHPIGGEVACGENILRAAFQVFRWLIEGHLECQTPIDEVAALAVEPRIDNVAPCAVLKCDSGAAVAFGKFVGFGATDHLDLDVWPAVDVNDSDTTCRRANQRVTSARTRLRSGPTVPTDSASGPFGVVLIEPPTPSTGRRKRQLCVRHDVAPVDRARPSTARSCPLAGCCNGDDGPPDFCLDNIRDGEGAKRRIWHKTVRARSAGAHSGQGELTLRDAFEATTGGRR